MSNHISMKALITKWRQKDIAKTKKAEKALMRFNSYQENSLILRLMHERKMRIIFTVTFIWAILVTLISLTWAAIIVSWYIGR